MPTYGLVCQPNRSARKTTRNSKALIVVSTMPTTEIGARIRRTAFGICGNTLSGRHHRPLIVSTTTGTATSASTSSFGSE